MKKIFAFIAIFGGLTLAAADPYYEATVKHVDAGGEMMTYCNITVPFNTLNNLTAKLAKVLGQENGIAKSAINCVLNVLDLTSFKACAQSSVEVEPGFFIYKDFVYVDGNSKSIFSNKALNNIELDFLSLPADTRLALVCDMNSAYVWKRLTQEIENSGDQALTAIFAKFKAEAMENGVDIDKIAESINGPALLAVAGESINDLKVVVFITDSNGAVSALLRQEFTPEDGSNVFKFKELPFLPNAKDAQLIYNKGSVMFVSDPRIIKSDKKLGDLPQYRKYADALPKNGYFLFLLDMPQKINDEIRSQIPDKARPFFQLKPFSIVLVGVSEPDGVACVAASSFSVPMCIFNVLEGVFGTALDAVANESAAQNRD